MELLFSAKTSEHLKKLVLLKTAMAENSIDSFVILSSGSIFSIDLNYWLAVPAKALDLFVIRIFVLFKRI